jgi:hypothetical protein
MSHNRLLDNRLIRRFFGDVVDVNRLTISSTTASSTTSSSTAGSSATELSTTASIGAAVANFVSILEPLRT